MSAPSVPSSRRVALGLGALLLAAAVLRFTGLSAGLRHEPHMDERYFVENVGRMLARGDLDHRYYEYPGLFFYLLLPALALVGAGPHPVPAAYLAARCVVAALGVLNVALAYALGARIAGRRAGVVAAALVAFSPVHVQTAHAVRPDVALETLVLVALMAVLRVGRPRADLRAGLAVGAAAALKFTGALLAASYLAQRVLTPGRRLQGACLAALAAAAAFAVLSPYAIVHAPDFLEGVTTQVGYHYQREGSAGASYPTRFAGYAAVWAKALGPPALVLALAGLAICARQWRAWASLFLLPLLTAAAMASTLYRFDRHMVPSFGVVALLAGVAVDALARRRGVLVSAVVACVAAGFPLSASIAYVRAVRQPQTADLIVDWIDAHVPPGSRILSAVRGLGFDRRRYEVIEVPRRRTLRRAQPLDADVVVAPERLRSAILRGLPVAFAARPATPFGGAPLAVRVVPRDRRPTYRPVPLAEARLQASSAPEALEALTDGRVETRWQTDGPQQGQEWVEIRLARPERLARVELVLGDSVHAGRALRLQFSPQGAGWRRLPSAPGRPRLRSQRGQPSQVLVFRPVTARGLRILQRGRSARAWAIAEIRLDTVDGGRGTEEAGANGSPPAR
ncbi:MAG: glycosyltransferase family 39 protein [Acidobacteria bacterium]|nr:glycosyltransferase family 39 protein [Acidobacteriota bacterium]